MLLIKRTPGKQQWAPPELQSTLALELLHCSLAPLRSLSGKALLRIEMFDVIQCDIIVMLLECYVPLSERKYERHCIDLYSKSSVL